MVRIRTLRGVSGERTGRFGNDRENGSVGVNVNVDNPDDYVISGG